MVRHAVENPSPSESADLQPLPSFQARFGCRLEGKDTLGDFCLDRIGDDNVGWEFFEAHDLAVGRGHLGSDCAQHQSRAGLKSGAAFASIRHLGAEPTTANDGNHVGEGDRGGRLCCWGGVTPDPMTRDVGQVAVRVEDHE